MRGAALILVLLVLSALAMIGAPFVISMALHDKASLHFSGGVASRAAADAARNHAIVHLEKSVYGAELEAEDDALDDQRPGVAARGKTGRTKSGAGLRPRGSQRKGRGVVRRRDLGEEQSAPADRDASRRARQRLLDAVAGSGQRQTPQLPDRYRISKAGPSPREFDVPGELTPPLLDEVLLPESGTTGLAGAGSTQGAVVFRFQDPRGITAAATVADEQGKIHLNSAPPNLLAALFGMSRLAEPLNPGDDRLALEDASMFRGDGDEATIDGAVIVGREAITYRRKSGNVLHGCFRGAFLSGVTPGTIKAETPVGDLRGWKAAYHRLWAQRHSGLPSGELVKFRSVEAIREIANWQVSSLFLAGFRGEGLTLELLQEAGWSPKKLSEIGIDPALFTGEAPPDRADEKARFDAARKKLRKVGVQNSLAERLRDRRGVRVVVDLAARLEGADKPTVERTVKSLEASLAGDRRRKGQISPRYLAEALKNLAEVYATPGIETIGPEDLEWLRETTTVDSAAPVEWLEAQALTDDATEDDLGRASVRMGRGGGLNRHTIVRFRNLADPGITALNEVAHGGAGGFTCATPMPLGLRAHEWTVEALARHPINVNTAPRRVLQAVFLGLGTMSARQADDLAARVIAARPLKGHDELEALLEPDARDPGNQDTDGEKGKKHPHTLFINAIAPTSAHLGAGTTGFVFKSGDVYAVEARGMSRSPAGTVVAEARYREIVEVSPARSLTLGLLTQADFAEGIYLRDARLAIGFPEDTSQSLLEIPGTRGHLVSSRPLLLPRVPRGVAGGDLSSLRLLATETPERDNTFTIGEIEHFPETHEGWGLDAGESWPIDMSAQGSNQPSPAVRGGGLQGAGGVNLRLNMIPGGIEFWIRCLTLPVARSIDGHVILFDAGAEEEERNRIQLLYADRFGKFLLRVHDASLRDPSVERTPENGQYLEIAAERPFDLGTWYHLRIIWDGVYGGGAQLFIDGLPAGTDNLSTELTGGIPESGGDAIGVKDARRLPKQGVVRIDQELFEYVKTGNSLRVRREAASTWKPVPQQPRLRQVAFAPIKLFGVGPGGGPVGPGGGGGVPLVPVPAPAAPPGAQPLGQVPPPAPTPQVDMTLQRAPGNRRGSTPGAHVAGARVALHGYSLEVRRKLRRPLGQQGGAEEFQIPDGDNRLLVWGRGGLTSRGFLGAWNFPLGVQGICHYEPVGELVGTDAFIVPLFYLNGASETAPVAPTQVSATLPGAEPRNAIDYFQDRGVVVTDVGVFLYKKERQLPPVYAASQGRDSIASPQTQGLRLLGTYPPGAGDQWLTAWNQRRRVWRDPDPFDPHGCAVYIEPTQRSVEAAGRIEGVYPPTGILEVPGVPAPWENRPARLGTSLFASHPDDAVEWIRYVEIFEGPYGGEDFHLFVGRTGRQSGFRGYPERHYPAQPLDYRRQLDHPTNQPLRLVMELSEGGAGWGDYVTIAGRNPGTSQPIFEPGLRRVYKVLEHEDGRFFASLVAAGENGQELSGPDVYSTNFTMAMSPRLVKFPTWGLPEIPATGGLIAGDSLAGTGSRGQGGSGGQRTAELTEDEWPVVIDEIRRLRTSPNPIDPRYTVRHVLVPLKGSSVDVRRSPLGAHVSGTISAGQMVSPSNPLEVMVVTLSRERGVVRLFAQGTREGLLRIGDELFYFEDPQGAGQAGNQGGAGILGIAANPQGNPNAVNPVNENLRERDPLERSRFVDRMPVSIAGGGFEPEGFARVEDVNVERQAFHEVFYYGRGFSQCLRGQFGTPIVPGGAVRNATRRLRLTGRGLLGTHRTAHSLGEAVSLVPLGTLQPLVGPVTGTGVAVKRADVFGNAGMLLIDTGDPARPWEVVAHLGPGGESQLKLPRDQRGRGILRGRFGTPQMPLGQGAFAYELPHRYPDRFDLEVESESLAYLQKSFRVPGAYWRTIEWLERPSATIRRKRSDVVIVARFDGAPDWDVKPTNAAGGLFVFEDDDPEREGRVKVPIDRFADQMEIRVYFRFPPGSFTRLPDGRISDDWKETAVLDGLWIEYEKAGTVVRHEELPF